MDIHSIDSYKFNIKLKDHTSIQLSEESLSHYYLKKNTHGYQLKEYVFPVWLHQLWMKIRNFTSPQAPTYFYSSALIEKIEKLSAPSAGKIKQVVDKVLLPPTRISTEELRLLEEVVDADVKVTEQQRAEEEAPSLLEEQAKRVSDDIPDIPIDSAPQEIEDISLQEIVSEKIQTLYRDMMGELKEIFSQEGEVDVLKNKAGTELKYFLKEIASSSHGTIYLRFHLQKAEIKVLKLAHQDPEGKGKRQLQREFDLHAILHKETVSRWGIQDKPYKIKKLASETSSFSEQIGLLIARCLCDLWEYNKKYPCENDFTAFFMFHQMLSGLKHVHDVGIAHCDIKTENFLIKKILEDQQLPIVQIADFGGAINGDSPQMPAITKECMTEQDYKDEGNAATAEELLEIGKQHDVFSMGLSMYETLCGGNPFLNPETTFCETDPYLPVFNEKNPLDILLKDMLSMDRKQRPTIEKALKRFEEIIGKENLEKIKSIKENLVL